MYSVQTHTQIYPITSFFILPLYWHTYWLSLDQILEARVSETWIISRNTTWGCQLNVGEGELSVSQEEPLQRNDMVSDTDKFRWQIISLIK